MLANIAICVGIPLALFALVTAKDFVSWLLDGRPGSFVRYTSDGDPDPFELA